MPLTFSMTSSSALPSFYPRDFLGTSLFRRKSSKWRRRNKYIGISHHLSFLRHDISIQTRNFCSSCVESVKVLVCKTFPLAGKRFVMMSKYIHTYIHKLYFSSNLRVAIIKANISEKTITKITIYTTTY